VIWKKQRGRFGLNPKGYTERDRGVSTGTAPSENMENPAYYDDVNITGTVKLLELIREKQIRSFLFASSSSVYGNNKKSPLLRE